MDNSGFIYLFFRHLKGFQVVTDNAEFLLKLDDFPESSDNVVKKSSRDKHRNMFIYTLKVASVSKSNFHITIRNKQATNMQVISV